ncbi:hypothetical protein, partial [Cellulomonas soli]|uniref:hypothetical protein n=1 Tax=Cellulomonas soli TaxID=931535 RepID=UPI0031F0C24A
MGPDGQVVWSVADVAATYPTMDKSLPGGDYVFRVSGLATLLSGTLSGPYDFTLYGFSEALAQSFDVDLSVPGVEKTLQNTSSTPGAGQLETTLSSDNYRFSVPADTSVVLTMQPGVSGPATLLWSLARSSGQVVDSGQLTGSTSKTIPALSGDYV